MRSMVLIVPLSTATHPTYLETAGTRLFSVHYDTQLCTLEINIKVLPFSFLLDQQQQQPLCISNPCKCGLYESSRSCRVMYVVLQDCSAGDRQVSVAMLVLGRETPSPLQ